MLKVEEFNVQEELYLNKFEDLKVGNTEFEGQFDVNEAKNQGVLINNF